MGASPQRQPTYTFSDVSVVMGTYNEEQAITTVLRDIEAATDGLAEIICVDGSTDATPDRAAEHGATVIRQEPQGYGIALQTALAASTRPVIITTDCDATYPMEELPAFLAAINQGYDVVSGNRLAAGAQSMPRFNRYGNRVFALLTSVLMGRRVHDTTTGMRAYRREVIESIEWTENTGLSAELLIRPALRGYRVVEHPIPYRDRIGETTLDPVRGGGEILAAIIRVCLQERLFREG